LPGYDPKNGGKATVFFGEEKTDYRKKDEVFTSVKVKNPPGGKSSIQFGWSNAFIILHFHYYFTLALSGAGRALMNEINW